MFGIPCQCKLLVYTEKEKVDVDKAFHAALIADHLLRDSKLIFGLIYRHHASTCHKLHFRHQRSQATLALSRGCLISHPAATPFSD